MLKSQVVSGISWVAFSNVLKQIIQIVSLVIFARLLSPDEFGIYAILMIFVVFFGMFADMGISQAIVHIKEPSSNLLSSIFYFNVFISILIFIIIYQIANLISIFFEKPAIEELLQLISLSFIIISFGLVQKAMFEKQMRFKVISIIEIFAVFISAGIGILLAYNGYGVYSLIAQTLVSGIVTVSMFWIMSNWYPKFYFSFLELKKVFTYSINLTGFFVINYFARNADNILIGKFLSSANLGVYSLAYKIMLYPLQNITHVIIRVLFPAFSHMQDDLEKLKKSYLKALFAIALITFPIMTGLIAISDVFVDVLFGSKWSGISLILIILAPVGMIQSIVSTVGSLYMALGNTNTMFKIGSANALVTVLSFTIGIWFGIEGVALSYAVANLIMLYPNLNIAWKQINLSVKDGLKVLTPIFVISVIMSLGVYILDVLIISLMDIQLIRLFSLIACGAILYIGLLKIYYKDIGKIFKELKK